MARFADEEDEPINKEIVYDSQEEQDQWPDSQPRNSPEDNSDNIRPPQCPPKECGKQTVRSPPVSFLILSHLMLVFPNATSFPRLMPRRFQRHNHLSHKGLGLQEENEVQHLQHFIHNDTLP
jgi:hypothetical protein